MRLKPKSIEINEKINALKKKSVGQEMARSTECARIRRNLQGSMKQNEILKKEIEKLKIVKESTHVPSPEKKIKFEGSLSDDDDSFNSSIDAMERESFAPASTQN